MYKRQNSIGSVNLFVHMNTDGNYQVVPNVDSGTCQAGVRVPHIQFVMDDDTTTTTTTTSNISTIDFNQIPLTVNSEFFTADSDEEKERDGFYSGNGASGVTENYTANLQQSQQRWSPVSNTDSNMYRPAEEFHFNAENNKELQEATEEALRSGNITPLVKEELKSSIQIKRLKEGKGELQVSFDDPKPDVLTPEEEIRVEVRRTQNRDAARRFRDRQKMKTSQLQKQCHKLEAENAKLRSEVSKLRGERGDLSTQFQQHMAICPLNTTQHPGFFIQNT